jgi:hypothetical protein
MLRSVRSSFPRGTRGARPLLRWNETRCGPETPRLDLTLLADPQASKEKEGFAENWWLVCWRCMMMRVKTFLRRKKPNVASFPEISRRPYLPVGKPPGGVYRGQNSSTTRYKGDTSVDIRGLQIIEDTSYTGTITWYFLCLPLKTRLRSQTQSAPSLAHEGAVSTRLRILNHPPCYHKTSHAHGSVPQSLVDRL